MALAASLLLGAAILLALAGLCFSFLILVRNVEGDLPRARTWARKVYFASALLSLLLAYRGSLPLSVLALSLLLSMTFVLSLSGKPSTYLLLFSHLALPLIAHYFLLSHLSHHTFRSHQVHAAPRLPGGRVSWDIPDEHVAAVQAGEHEVHSVAQTVTYFIVFVWAQTYVAWAMWMGAEGRQRWGLPFVSFATEREGGSEGRRKDK
ncbi:hypothetical protein BCV69DRAFT_47181 [Microstroma glucosiphilum]|uniref:Uncharacterized protein n=1 Tax=Pseudomicrostroma glucosiphilum TaxID=1684307 RepID=A0A316U1D7_9BASI|nr:hypothetical protein BCV69DRAFT_47181 [Pseudomicrostroma glucosiphilum]PWN19192.1 hypothetical protein BCV69DRAFT_47181 [Pseudomicrostroma glucosiphilum]